MPAAGGIRLLTGAHAVFLLVLASCASLQPGIGAPASQPPHTPSVRVDPHTRPDDLLGSIGDSVCSHPRRAGVKAAAEMELPAGGEAILARDVNAFAAETGFQSGGVEAWSGSNEPPWYVHSFFLNSPRNTVLLVIQFDTRRRTIRLRVERDCFDDSPLEDWRPYWSALLRHMRARNYVVRPVSRVRRR
jgi:hypothetical protein